jgi:hypothetical protein
MDHGADLNAADKNGLSLTMDAKFRRILGGFVRGDSTPAAPTANVSQPVPLSQIFQVTFLKDKIHIIQQPPTNNNEQKQTIRQAPQDIPTPSWNNPSNSSPVPSRMMPTSLSPTSISSATSSPKSTTRQPVVISPQPVMQPPESDIPDFAPPSNFSTMFENKVVVTKQPTPSTPASIPRT